MKKLVNIHNKTKEITEELSPFNNTNVILNDSDLNNFFKNHNVDYQFKNINLKFKQMTTKAMEPPTSSKYESLTA